ncbi:MAG: multicopper oxidase domain-containing protein [Edaphobacter sp.]
MDAAAHPNLTVTMKEINQAVLPQGSFAACGAGVTLGQTRVWTYQTTDSDTGAMLGPAHWPAVTIVTQRHKTTQVQYVNKLPSFNQANPNGPGLVQGVLAFDQTIHWADPLQSHCGMQKPAGSQSAKMPDHKMAMGADHDNLEDIPNSRLKHQVGHLQPASYPIGSSKGSNRKSAMEAGMQSSTDPCKQQYYGPVPATVHLHGAEVDAAYDGGPDSWFTPNGLKGTDYHSTGNPSPGSAIYQYPNSQEAGTLWFHDHTLGTTRINVYAGLAGFYFLRDADREPQGYPSNAYEIEMAIQDRLFDTNSQLYFPQQQIFPNNDNPFWSVYFEGDVATVNGAAFPYLNVEPRRYRFHLLNGCNNRSLKLSFGSAAVYQIGADDNYLDKPASVSDVTIQPGERADVVVDFSKSAGQNITVKNTGAVTKIQLPEIMQFKVGTTVSTPDTSCDPTNPDPSTGTCARKNPMVRLADGNGNKVPGLKVDQVRQMVFNEYVNYPTTIKENVNNTAWNGLLSPGIAKDFPIDGISELPREGSIEEWDIANIATMGQHPFHIHLVQFQILNRQNLDMNATTGYGAAWQAAFGPGLPTGCTAGQVCLDYGPPLDYLTPNGDGALGGNLAFSSHFATDPKNNNQVIAPVPPDPGESGWKDTVDIPSGGIVRLLVRWTPSDVPVVPNESYAGQNLYQFDPTQGYYVWHCHLINHEDNEMMRPYRVTP